MVAVFRRRGVLLGLVCAAIVAWLLRRWNAWWCRLRQLGALPLALADVAEKEAGGVGSPALRPNFWQRIAMLSPKVFYAEQGEDVGTVAGVEFRGRGGVAWQFLLEGLAGSPLPLPTVRSVVRVVNKTPTLALYSELLQLIAPVLIVAVDDFNRENRSIEGDDDEDDEDDEPVRPTALWLKGRLAHARHRVVLLGVGSGLVLRALRRVVPSVVAFEPCPSSLQAADVLLPNEKPLASDPSIIVPTQGQTPHAALTAFVQSLDNSASVIIADLGRTPSAAGLMTSKSFVASLRRKAKAAVLGVAQHTSDNTMLAVVPLWQEVFDRILTIRAGPRSRLLIGSPATKINSREWLPPTDFLECAMQALGGSSVEIKDSDVKHYCGRRRTAPQGKKGGGSA